METKDQNDPIQQEQLKEKDSQALTPEKSEQKALIEENKLVDNKIREPVANTNTESVKQKPESLAGKKKSRSTKITDKKIQKSRTEKLENQGKKSSGEKTKSTIEKKAKKIENKGRSQKLSEIIKEESIAKEDSKGDKVKKGVGQKKVKGEPEKKPGGEKPGIKKVKADKKKKPEDKKDTGEDTIVDEAVKKDEEEVTVKAVDYSTFSKEELINTLTILVEERPIQEIRNDVENIKTNFYKKHKVELEKQKKKFLEESGEPGDFKPEEDALENQLKQLLKKYKDAKAAYNRELEEQKHINLEEKYKIIEEIKDLINRKESINKTFQEFRELQARWRTVGVVPQQNLKDLWETYHHHVEKFYDYIKINKELRDLDLKKNMEAKITLCEKAEELLLEPSIVHAFKILQKYHEQWREIGPVPHEAKTELWDRFRETTSKINKKHQDYYENLKSAQKRNLEAKTHLCEKVEEINNTNLTTHREWNNKSNEVVELQKVWRTIGYAPKKSNNKIYQRFRNACDEFFNRKREFYTENKEMQNNNLQLKTELCMQAEGLQDSTEWKKTTEEFISLQKKWKEIGPVPSKQSDKIWKRFRTACDNFFKKKSEYYSQIDKEYEDNLKHKKDLITEIEKFKPGEDTANVFEKLKEFQRKWTEIGFVPFDEKDKILQNYRVAINKQFDKLDIDENQRNLLKYKNKLENLRDNPKASVKLKHDREKFINKIKQLESDIVLWENNIGFFAKSKSADSLIKEVKEKIENAKNAITLLKEKMKLIDQSE
jgi:hypothetical protein